MAKELGPFTSAAKCVVYDPDDADQVRDVLGTAWITLTAATFANCIKTAVQEGATGIYFADMPASLDLTRRYTVAVYGASESAFSGSHQVYAWEPENAPARVKTMADDSISAAAMAASAVAEIQSGLASQDVAPAVLLPQGSDAHPIVFRMSATGLTPAVTLSKNGSAFAAAAGTVSEIGDKWYKLTPAAADTGTVGSLVVRATAGAEVVETLAQIYADATSALTAAVAAQITEDHGAGNYAAGGAGACDGPGAQPCSWQWSDDDTAEPLINAQVWITTDAQGANVIARGATDDGGSVSFMLDDGVGYYLWMTHPDYEPVRGEAFVAQAD